MVVWTNGCFDLLHAGHVLFLQAARSLGDVLVVGVNSDESVRRLKGSDRPFQEFASRVTLLKSIRYVDHVVAMSEDTPCIEIGELRPDVCCKDDSYSSLPLPERALVESYGGRMVLLPRVGGWSSTAIAERVRSSAGDGAQ